MPTFIPILSLGFLLGLRHATDADHVVAVSTITTKQKHIRGGALIGILWGVGHSITVTLVGIPIIFFSLKIPAKIGLALEFSIGIMLVVLGLVNLYGIRSKILKAITNIIHKHNHSHSNKKHSHLHLHFKSNNQTQHHLSFLQMFRPLLIGLAHGLAGGTAIAILILSTIRNNFLAVVYLIIFHIGVVAGMMIVTTLLGASITVVNKKVVFLQNYLVAGSGLLSLIFGIYIMH